MADNLIESYLFRQSTSTEALRKTLDAQALRQKAHAQNIANAETPGYRRAVVDFEDLLQSTLGEESSLIAKSHPRHLGGGSSSLSDLRPIMRQEELDPNGPGVNGVDVDREMAEMAETQLRYMAALELLKRRYAGLKSVIRGQP